MGVGKHLSRAITYGPRVFAVGANLKNGDGVIKSVFKPLMGGLIDASVSNFVGAPMAAFKAVNTIEGLMNGAIANGRTNARQMSNYASYGQNIGNGRPDISEYGVQARDRGLNAIGSHADMTRNALGSEARRRSTFVRF